MNLVHIHSASLIMSCKYMLLPLALQSVGLADLQKIFPGLFSLSQEKNIEQICMMAMIFTACMIFNIKEKAPSNGAF